MNERAVAEKLVWAIQSQNLDVLDETLELLLEANVPAVVLELLELIQEATGTQDPADLISRSYLILPEYPLELLQAVLADDLSTVHTLTGPDISDALASLMTLAASIQAALPTR